jgi:demethylmenaquinone methyltransferase/2-methoxy-6-polyprenyl-1,4-benzoquinol methylase
LPSEKRSKVTVVDINPSMLKVGEERARKLGYFMSPEDGDPHIQFVEGNAERLPVPDESMDVYTIAFGIR